MKNPKTTSVLVGLGLVLVLAFGYKTSLTTTFINNTGQAVGGLHIQYNSNGFIYLINQNPATFGNVQIGVAVVDLGSGTVGAGGNVQISLVTFGPVKNIRNWWWTDGSGNLVGKTHNGCRTPDCTDP